MGNGADLMGRPKKGGVPKTSKSQSADERETVIHMKGSPGYVAWLDAVHRKTRIPKVQIFRWAIAEWAERHGHQAPPEI